METSEGAARFKDFTDVDDTHTGDVTTSRPAFNQTAPAAGLSRSRHGSIRPLERADIGNVAELFLQTFRQGGAGSSLRAHDDVSAYLDELYLKGPFSQTGINSLVQVDRHGNLGGFLGLVKTSYQLDEDDLSACLVGTLMAAPGPENGMAAPQLMRALKETTFDVMLTDSANRASLPFAGPMKYEICLTDSLQWVLAFQPAAMLVDKVRKKWPRIPLGLLSPLTRGTDVLAGKLLNTGRHRAVESRWRSEAITAAAFVTIAPRFLPNYRLRPAWPAEELSWLVQRAMEKTAHGPLNFHQVCDDAGTIVGCHAYYGQPGSVAQVLQVLALKSRWSVVVQSLMRTTRDHGCIGVAGKAQTATMPHLFQYPGLFFHYSGGTMVSSHRRDVIEAVRAGEVFVGGLAGDTWTRLSADEFGKG